MELLAVDFVDAVNQPAGVSNSVNAFLGGSLDEAKMASVDDKRLYRSK